MLNTPDANGETPTFDDALKQLKESIPNFISLRASTVNQFELENINGWDKAEDVPEKHKLLDPIQESVLNADGAVIIGNYIVMYLDLDLVVSFDKRESQIYSYVREIPQTARVSHIAAAKWIGDIDMLKVMTFSVPSQTGVIIGTGGGQVTLGDKFSFIVSPEIRKNPCDPFKVTLRSFAVQRNNNIMVSVSGNYNINWGDGTSNSGSIVLGNSNSLDHTYATAGTYHPTIVVTAIGSDGQIETLTPSLPSIDAGTGDCFHRTDRSKTKDPVYSSDGNAYIKAYALFRSGLANNIQAETEYYQKNSAGKFKNVKNGSGKQISAKIYGGISFNSSCENMSQKEASELKQNKSSVRGIERYSLFSPIFMYTLYSNHYAYYGNEKIEVNLEIPNCR